MSDTPKVTGSPDVIYLIYGELEHDDTHDNLVDESGGEVTWFPQFQSDVCYARMDILMEARKECAELREENEALKCGEYICQSCGLRKDSEFEPGDF